MHDVNLLSHNASLPQVTYQSTQQLRTTAVAGYASANRRQAAQSVSNQLSNHGGVQNETHPARCGPGRR
jgi:hypothetical protein